MPAIHTTIAIPSCGAFRLDREQAHTREQAREAFQEHKLEKTRGHAIARAKTNTPIVRP